MKNLNLIVAVARGGAIGKDNDLLWHISDDLKRFKALTTGNIVVMGRKTYESFPKRPLPNRRHIVLTTQGVEPHPDVECVAGVESALAAVEARLEAAAGQGVSPTGARTASEGAQAAPQAFVIGGGRVYAQLLPYCERAYITEVDAEYPDADTFFPALSPSEWRIVDTGPWQIDEKSGLRFRYVEYERR